MHPSVQQQILSESLGQFFSAIPQAAGCRKRRSSDPVKNDAKNVSVSFVKGEHGDLFPFDGEGGTVGHVIFPRSNASKYTSLEIICDISREDQGKRVNLPYRPYTQGNPS